MNRNFAIKLVLVGIAFSIIQQLSADLTEFWYDDDEFFDIDKRQNWESFKGKHVVESPSIQRNDDYWNRFARERLGSKYGGMRRLQTFIRVDQESNIMNNFDGVQKCRKDNYKWFKSMDTFNVVEMEWNRATGKYDVEYPQTKWHICAALDSQNRPLHFAGKEP